MSRGKDKLIRVRTGNTANQDRPKTAGTAGLPSSLFSDVRRLIEQARARTAVAVNVGQTMLYWQVGRRVGDEILGGQRAAYGERIIADLACALETDYGRGFAEKNLRRMVQFAEAFPDAEIVATLSRQLSWSQFVLLLPVKDALAREFYAEMCRVESWNVRTLRTKIQGMLFERTSLSRNPEQLARQELATLRSEDRMTPDIVFRDPYLLDFVGLRGAFSEKDLETALVRELGDFILELGVGFTFVERQKRITVDGRDYYLDLLFYHRRLRRLVAVELKLGEFQAADKGQMELYLRWLDKHDRVSGEETPLGLILCAGKSEEHVELLEVKRSGIRVAQYLTELPPQDVLRERLHRMVQAVRERHAALGVIGAETKPRSRRQAKRD
jgi:predicted nuclease of restriction endonuclease-like (RecB) superfamily